MRKLLFAVTLLVSGLLGLVAQLNPQLPPVVAQVVYQGGALAAAFILLWER